MKDMQPPVSPDIRHEQLLPGLYRFEDTCNVYILCQHGRAIVIDYGSGAWRKAAAALNLPPIERVYLTHHHADQCAGLERETDLPFTVHAPAEEAHLYQPESLKKLHADKGGMTWFPNESYNLLAQGVPEKIMQFDMTGFSDHDWRGSRIRFLHTPGHGAHALSILVDHHDQQLVFCGDAVHHGATIHQPYHLEWDHWTAGGAIEAQQGITRLEGLHIDMLLPSHGQAISGASAVTKNLVELQEKLAKFIRAKGQVYAGEKDHYLTPLEQLDCRAVQLLPSLYWFHNGGYLLRSTTGEAIITDPHGDLEKIQSLLDELENRHHKPTRITAQLVTHYHGDHMSQLTAVRERWGAKIILHPSVADMLAQAGSHHVPFLTRERITPDEIWPARGQWRWNEYTFEIAHMPGQTWWHCGFMTKADGKKVLFAGDTFQPPSRWNGTGGFCSINGCRFHEGFASTAQHMLDWRPDILVNGHATWRHFSPSAMTKTIAWAKDAHAAVTALCPSGDAEKDYFLHEPIAYDQ